MTEIVHTFSYKDITNFISLWSRSFNLFSYIFNCIVSFYSRVRIIGSHFANCKVNSSYCNCKVVNGTKIAKQFFSQGKFSLSKLYFPHHILVLFIHCILLSKEIMLIPKITRVKASLRLEYSLRSEFQTIIRALYSEIYFQWNKHTLQYKI